MSSKSLFVREIHPYASYKVAKSSRRRICRTFVSDATIAAPPYGLVEGNSSLVAFYGPHYRLIVAVRNQITQSDRHQFLANTRAPVRRIDRDSIKFAEACIHRISAGTNADEPCN